MCVHAAAVVLLFTLHSNNCLALFPYSLSCHILCCAFRFSYSEIDGTNVGRLSEYHVTTNIMLSEEVKGHDHTQLFASRPDD